MYYRDFSLGLTTKARACKGASWKQKPRSHIITKNERGDILNKHPNNSLVPCTLGVYEFLQQATSFILLFHVFIQEFACKRLLIFATYTTYTYIPLAALIPKARVQDPTHWSFIDTVHIHTNSAELITKARTLKFYLQVTQQNANFFATAYVIQIKHLTTLSPSDQNSQYALGPWSLWPWSLQIAVTQPYCTLHLLITHDSKALKST